MPEPTEQQQKQDALKFKPDTEELCKLLDELNGEIEKAFSGSNGWRKKIDEALLRRKGLIGKKRPDVPFRDSSDIRYRIEEQVLRKLNPYFTLPLRQAPKIARYIPLNAQDSDKADDLEYYMQWLLYGETEDINRVWKLLANKRNECVGVVKIIWEYKTEPRTKTYSQVEFAQQLAPFMVKKLTALNAAVQADPNAEVPPDAGDLDDKELKAAIADIYGWRQEKYAKRIESVAKQWKAKKDIITVIVDEVTKAGPAVIPITDLNYFGVPLYTTRIQDAEWVWHERDYTERELLQSRDRFDHVDELIEKVKQVLSSKSDATDKTQYRQIIERASKLSSTDRIEGKITVRELYCWVPRNLIARFNGMEGDDDAPVRCVINYCPGIDPEEVPPLRVMEYGYEHGKWPFEEDIFNLTEDMFYSAEGAGMMIQPYSEEYDRSRNAAMDRETITLSPPTLVWSQSKLSTSNFRQVGQVMQVPFPVGDNVVHIPRFPDLSSKLEMTAEFTRAYAEQLAGVPSTSAMPHYSDPPTKAQVEQTVAPANAMQSEELGSWTDFIGRILRHIHDLCAQFTFPIKTQKNVTVPKLGGQPGETVTITPEHFQAKYMIFCGADVSRNNPMLESQKLVAWYQLVAQNPVNAPFVKPFDAVHLLTTKMIGHIESQTVLQDKDAAQQLSQQFMQMQAQALAQMQMAQQNKMKRGGGPNNQGAGGMRDMAGSDQGIFTKRVGA